MTKAFLIVLSAALGAAPAYAQTIAAGKQQFEGRCAGCHGADGAGGERAPGIVDIRHGRSQSPREIIRNGIPDAGMPSFQKILNSMQVRAIQAYIVSRARESAKPDGNQRK